MGLLKDLVTGRLNESPRQMVDRNRAEDRRYFVGLRERGVISEEQLQLELEFNGQMHDVMTMMFSGEISQSEADLLMREYQVNYSMKISLALGGRGIEPVMGLVPPSGRR